jgi:DNA invertase Pin-like site-specific DNA recombinase
MKVNYIRVSHETQNKDVQEFNLSNEYKVFKETCSGSIAFSERPEGAKIMKLVKEGKVEEILIHDISRIGRNNLDVLNMIQFFTSNNVNLISRREGLSTMLEGKPNPIASLIIGIMSTLAEYELNRLRDRRNEGIARAKERGVYANHGGNRREETREEFMAKSDTKKIVKYLREGNSLRRTSKLAEASLGKVQKVVRVLESIERMDEALATPEPERRLTLKDLETIENELKITPEPTPKAKIVTKLISDRANAIDMTRISMREWLYLPKNLHLHESDAAREKFLEEEEARSKIGRELEAQRKANLK